MMRIQEFSARAIAICSVGLATAVLPFALGCGEERKEASEALAGAGEKMGAAAEQAKKAAADATAEAEAAAADAAAKAKAVAADAAAAVTPEASPVQTCVQLAAKMDWKNALEPCEAAAKERPDDLKIRHALQQAKAAAADSMAN